MNGPLDLLAIMAHPDDAELLCGGTLIKASKAGERVGVLDLTRGEAGSFGTPETRDREAAEAADIMGLAVRENAGLPDGALAGTPEARARVAGWIRKLRPRIVVTHWREGRHPDHRVAAELAYDASYLAGLTKLDVPGDRSPFRPEKVVYATAFREDAVPPTVVVDITDEIDRKLEALRAYGSQFEGKTAMGEVFPGGSRPILDQVRAQCAHYGSLIRRAYGEPFHVREAVEVDQLSRLGVATF